MPDSLAHVCAEHTQPFLLGAFTSYEALLRLGDARGGGWGRGRLTSLGLTRDISPRGAPCFFHLP